MASDKDRIKERTMKRAIGYCRVSKSNENGCSLKVQRDKIKSYAQLKDLKLIKIFEDDGKSGKDLNRDGMQEVLELVKKKKVDAVIVYRLDRGFRSTLDLLNCLNLFEKKGVSFHSVEESLDTKSAYGEFAITLIGSIARLERRMISDRMKSIQAYKRAHGFYQGGLVPYGFEVKDNKLIENKDEQEVLKLIKKMRKQGLNLLRISKDLNEKGIKTKMGKRWYPTTVKNLLKE